MHFPAKCIVFSADLMELAFPHRPLPASLFVITPDSGFLLFSVPEQSVDHIENKARLTDVTRLWVALLARLFLLQKFSGNAQVFVNRPVGFCQLAPPDFHWSSRKHFNVETQLSRLQPSAELVPRQQQILLCFHIRSIILNPAVRSRMAQVPQFNSP